MIQFHRYNKKKVYDKQGKYLGKVINIIRKNNLNFYEGINVKKNILSKKIKILKKEIEIDDKTIILKKKWTR